MKDWSMKDTDTEDILSFALTLAREAGELIVRERASEAITQQFKNGIELVTNADLMADKLICEGISRQFPAHIILSEESSPELAQALVKRESTGGDSGNAELSAGAAEAPIWIIDPIDGTVNYAHGHIQSGVSIAYVQNGQIQLGVVFNPFTDEMFSARLGAGASLNGEPIKVAQETELRRAIIATGFPYDKSNLEPIIRRVHAVLSHCADIRRLGSAALDICWVAVGRLDGFYESLSLWDFAAAQLIAREAGAQYGHFGSVPSQCDPQFYDQNILVANPNLYPKLRLILDEASDH